MKIKSREERCWQQSRATIGLLHGKHFKTAAVANVALVLEEETECLIIDSKTELAFPEADSLKVGQVVILTGHQERYRVCLLNACAKDSSTEKALTVTINLISIKIMFK